MEQVHVHVHVHVHANMEQVHHMYMYKYMPTHTAIRQSYMHILYMYMYIARKIDERFVIVQYAYTNVISDQSHKFFKPVLVDPVPEYWKLWPFLS